MVATQLLVTIFIAAASATGLVAREDAYFASLLKRQEPGTPAYNCHDNCGSAITLSRSADPCNNAVFVADYNNCLKCSGPDNYNIWRYYGGTLSSAGAKCGFDTEPLAGKQEDVPAAGSTGGASSAAPAQTSAATQSSAAPSATPSAAASSAPAPSSAAGAGSQAATTTEATTSESPVSSAAVSSALLTTVISPVISSAPVYSTIIANGTLSSPVSGVPSPSTNASASFTASAPAEVTTNAAAGLHVADAAGVFGAVLLGAFFGM